jgi:hypothetical protein
MLPSFLDLSTMTWIMYLIMAVGVIVGLMVIKSGEKPMLRVVVTVLIAVLVLTCYVYTKQLRTCDKEGTKCTFFGMEVPADGGFIN